MKPTDPHVKGHQKRKVAMFCCLAGCLVSQQIPCSTPSRKFWVQAGRMQGLHASLTMLLLTVSHGYILCTNFKMGDIFAIKYPFWICAIILKKYVHVFLMTSRIRWNPGLGSTPWYRLNSNSNSRGFNSNSNSNSGQSPEYQLQLQFQLWRFHLQFQLQLRSFKSTPISISNPILLVQTKLEQLERLRSEDTPRRPMITHIIDQFKIWKICEKLKF